MIKEEYNKVHDLIRKICLDEIGKLPHHFDEKINDVVYDSTEDLDRWLCLNKFVGELIQERCKDD